jgi:hypothetical protein
MRTNLCSPDPIFWLSLLLGIILTYDWFFMTLVQRIALAWMIQKETRNPHCSGGILADDQVFHSLFLIIVIKQKQYTDN